MKHTPGPWHVGYHANSGLGKNRHTLWIGINAADGWQFAIAGAYRRRYPSGQTEHNGKRPLTSEVIEANARLIAAAPELLAACQAALVSSEASEGGGWTTLNAQLRTAIAKAETCYLTTVP